MGLTALNFLINCKENRKKRKNGNLSILLILVFINKSIFGINCFEFLINCKANRKRRKNGNFSILLKTKSSY